MSGYILLRADASDKIGAGHVMRMIALGQMVQDAGLRVCFLTATRNPGILARLRSEGFYIQHLEESQPGGGQAEYDAVAATGRQFAADWIVLDGYQFDTAYQRHLKEHGFRLMCVDDLATGHFVADIVLNQNLRATRRAYSAEAYTQFFIGPRHVLLRREFRQARRGLKTGGRLRKVAVSMGAIDSGNVTAHTLDCLAELDTPDLQVKVILGALNPHHRAIEEQRRHLPLPIDLVCNAGPELADIFQWADLVISAAGTTLFEALYMRAALICHQAADNQAVNDLSDTAKSTNPEVVAVVEALNRTAKRFYAVEGIEVGLFNPAILAGGGLIPGNHGYGGCR